MKFIRHLIILLAAVTLLAACQTNKSSGSLSQAKRFFASQEYDKAIQAYQKADKSTPNNVDIKMGLIQALATSAVSAYEEVDTRPEEDLDYRVELLNKADKHRNQAIQELSKVERLKPLDPQVQAPFTRPTQLLLPYDDSMKYSAQVKLYRETLSKHQGFVEKKSKEENTKRNAIIAEIEAVQAKTTASKDGAVKAYEAFQPYNKYTPYMAKAKSAKAETTQNAIDYYENEGLKALSSNKYTTATTQFNKAKAISSASHQAEAGLIAVTTKKQINAKKYPEAYDNLLKIESIHPQSAFYKKHMKNTRTRVVNDMLAKAAKLASSSDMNKKAKAFEIYRQAKPIAQADTSLTSKVRNAISSLQNKIGQELAARAVVLNQHNSMVYSSNVASLLAAAYGFSEESVQDYKWLAERANAVTSERQGLNFIYATRDGKANEFKPFSQWLDDEVYTALVKQELKGMKINSLEKLKHEASALSSNNALTSSEVPFDFAEVVFLLNITKHDVRESGRDRASYKASKYVSSQRMIPNPEYDKAREAITTAETSLAEVEELERKAFSQCQEMSQRAAQSGGFALDCTYGSMELEAAQSTLSKARNTFATTPKEVEEKITSDYKYEEYTIRVKGQIAATLSAYDRRTNNSYKIDQITLDIDKKGKLRQGVKESDATGIKNGEDNTPKLSQEIHELEKQIQEKIVAGIPVFLEQHRWQRFCTQAKRLESKRRPHLAADAYYQCLNTAKTSNADSKELAKVNASIQKYMGFSPDMVVKYGRNQDFQKFGQDITTPLSADEKNKIESRQTVTFLSNSQLSIKPLNMASVLPKQLAIEEKKAKQRKAQAAKLQKTKPKPTVTKTVTPPKAVKQSKPVVKKVAPKSVKPKSGPTVAKTVSQPAKKVVEKPAPVTPPTTNKPSVTAQEPQSDFDFDFDIVAPDDL